MDNTRLITDIIKIILILSLFFFARFICYKLTADCVAKSTYCTYFCAQQTKSKVEEKKKKTPDWKLKTLYEKYIKKYIPEPANKVSCCDDFNMSNDQHIHSQPACQQIFHYCAIICFRIHHKQQSHDPSWSHEQSIACNQYINVATYLHQAMKLETLSRAKNVPLFAAGK